MRLSRAAEHPFRDLPINPPVGKLYPAISRCRDSLKLAQTSSTADKDSLGVLDQLVNVSDQNNGAAHCEVAATNLFRLRDPHRSLRIPIRYLRSSPSGLMCTSRPIRGVCGMQPAFAVTNSSRCQ